MMTTYKFHPVAELFPLIEGPEFDDLVDDIRKRGLIEAIWLHPDDRIIDGRNRYRACQKAGIEPRFRNWNGKGSLVEFVVSLNLKRRHLTASQRAVLAVEVEPMLAKEAAERQKALAGTRPSKHSNLGERFPQGDKGRAKEKAGKLFNVNPHYVQDAKKLKSTHREVFDEVRTGKKTIQQAKAAVKAETKQLLADKIRREPAVTPEGPFRVIVIDPPWKYESRAEDATHRGRTPYPDMTVEEIKNLRIGARSVAELAYDDCILWLWTTNAFMEQAFECLRSWGFENKVILTWVKDRMGLGDWLRGQTEHCLMAVKGHPLVTLSNQTTALHGRLREHSRKPAEFYALVESLCPGNKLDVFGREQREAWQVWGAEAAVF